MITTLPTDSNERKNYAIFRGCVRYFPAALAGVSKVSKLGNDKHNPGKEELFHDRNKSQDHGDCVLRHLMDVADLIAAMDRGDSVSKEEILTEVSAMAWRALALSQQLHEKLGGAPLAPGAKDTKKTTSEPSPWEQQEKAHKDIVERLKQHKVEMAKKFIKGDAIKHINNDIEVTVEALYYDEQGNPILFVRDADEKIFGVDPNFYRSIYKE